MIFPIVSILLLISNTFAAPLDIEKRDDKEVRDSLIRTADAVKEATRFLKAHYHPRGKDGFFEEAIQRQRNFNVLIRDETIRLSSAPSLSVFEWIGLSTITFPLGKNHQEFANAWISLRDSSGPRDQEVLSSIQETLSDGMIYMDTLWTKTNGLSGALTNTIRTQFGTIWNQAVQAYKTTSSFGGENQGGYQGSYQGSYSASNQGFGGNQGGSRGSIIGSSQSSWK